MFCPIFQLSEITGLSLNEYVSCDSECSYFKKSIKNKCKISESKNEHLTNNKYSWILKYAISFNEEKISKSKNTIYLNAVNLTHPLYVDLWIVRSKRYYKLKDEWAIVYRLYKNPKECIELDDLQTLNVWLKRNHYNGRKITEDDFILKG